jgi:hypothetical protein
MDNMENGTNMTKGVNAAETEPPAGVNSAAHSIGEGVLGRMLRRALLVVTLAGVATTFSGCIWVHHDDYDHGHDHDHYDHDHPDWDHHDDDH